MPRALWTCPACEHEAYAYDEIDHDCLDEEGNAVTYEAKGDELARDRDDFDCD